MSAVNPKQSMTIQGHPKNLRNITNFQTTFSIDYDDAMKKPKNESKVKGSTVLFVSKQFSSM